MVAGILVVVAAGDYEGILGSKMTQVPGHLCDNGFAARNGQAAALDEVVLQIHDQQGVLHDRRHLTLDWRCVAGDRSWRAPIRGCRRGGMADAPALGASARRAVKLQTLSPTPPSPPT